MQSFAVFPCTGCEGVSGALDARQDDLAAGGIANWRKVLLAAQASRLFFQLCHTSLCR